MLTVLHVNVIIFSLFELFLLTFESIDSLQKLLCLDHRLVQYLSLLALLVCKVSVQYLEQLVLLLESFLCQLSVNFADS